MPKAKVIEFAKERGFGKLQLEDGTILNFDASISNSFDIGPGDVGEAELKELAGRVIVRRLEFDVPDE